MITDPRKFVSSVVTEVRSRHFDPNHVEAAENTPFLMDPDLTRTMFIPDYKFYMYNVGPLEHIVPKGSAGPPGGYVIPACPKGQAYTRPLEFPALIADTYLDAQSGLIKAHWMRGEDMCRDIVHPMNGRMWSIGQNLDDFGVFWTKNNPPLPAELEEAKRKMEITFRAALGEANMLEAQNRFDLITPLMRHAASWYDEDRKWNQTYKRTIECPVCGGAMKAGIAIHTCGAVLDWPKAIFNSARTFADAKNHGVYSELLEKQVAELREIANRPKPAAGTADSGSFISSAELMELETKEDPVAVPPVDTRIKERVKTDTDLDVTRAARSKTGKKPPAPKRPKNFQA